VRALVIGAFLAPVSHLAFAWLAVLGPDLHALLIAIGIENAASGFAGTVLIAYMSSLTRVGFTATQYALFSSLYSLPGKLRRTYVLHKYEAEMREAILHLAFDGLAAKEAGSDAFVDNHGSNAVSRSLGYQPNGFDWGTRRGEPAQLNRWRLDRAAWEPQRRDDIRLHNVDACHALLPLT